MCKKRLIMNKRNQQSIISLFLYVFYFSKNVYEFKHILKNQVIFFLILRKLTTNFNIKLKLVEILFFVKNFSSKKKCNIYIYIFQNQILILITFFVLNIKINLKLFKKKSLKHKLTEFNWIIKKEYLKIEFNKINFFILFDKLKAFIQSKRVLYNFFKYHQLNQTYSKKKHFFQNFFCISIKLYLGFFDGFIFFSFKKYKILFKKWLKQRLNTNLSKKSYYLFLVKHNQSFLYSRFNTSFFLKTSIKNVYFKQVNQELIHFINFNMKFRTRNHCLSVVAINKKINFLGFHFFKNKKYLILNANFHKILLRFFLLNYINKFKKPITRFKQYFLFKQFLFLIKLKLILQSITSYYKNVKNKKDIISRIKIILKVFLVNILNKKLSFKSRAQVFTLFKKDLCQFLTKKS